MASVVISGDTSGSVTITAPAVAGTPTLTLPTTTDTLVGKATTDTLTNKTLTSPTISGAVVSSMNSSVITSGTATATTSGTSIDFTSIPSWVKRITVMFNGVSTSGTSNPQVQLGTSSGITITGYVSTGTNQVNNASPQSAASTSGFLCGEISLAAGVLSGIYVITNISGNIWVGSFCGKYGSTQTCVGGGNVTLGAILDRVRLTTINGTDTFDAGSINIIYE